VKNEKESEKEKQIIRNYREDNVNVMFSKYFEILCFFLSSKSNILIFLSQNLHFSQNMIQLYFFLLKSYPSLGIVKSLI
jgi:hypothetical protein